MDKQNLPKPDNLNDMFEAAKPELAAIQPNTIIRRLVSRERVLELSARMLASWPTVIPAAQASLSPSLCAECKELAAGLAERAWIFYSADLDLGSAYSDAARREREALAARVRNHDRRLMLWARLDFEGDAQAEETLADIALKHGRRDDAEDVVRLVKMFRQAAKAGQAISVSQGELDAAEADAKRQLDLLSVDPGSAARLLAGQAYTAWYRDYDALMGVGRFLTRGQAESLEMFPGVRMVGTRRGGGVEDESGLDEELDELEDELDGDAPNASEAEGSADELANAS